jgi:hypothetical protein
MNETPPPVSVEEQYNAEVERLVSYLQKSYKSRVKWSRTGKWQQAIQCEMGIALSMGRMDLLGNLMERYSKLSFLEQKRAEIEYEQRFSEVSSLPEESMSKDSTQSLPESEKEFADRPKE